MSELSRGPETLFDPEPGPPGPLRSPQFIGAVPSGPLRSPDRTGPVPSVPPIKGTGDQRTGDQGSWTRRKGHLQTHHCGAWVMVGLDRDRCALGARVDPYALSPAGEVEAIRAGRKTYHYRNGELDPRDRWSIPGSPPTHDLIVLAEHDCTPIPDSWLMPPAPPTPPKPPKEMF